MPPMARGMTSDSISPVRRFLNRIELTRPPVVSAANASRSSPELTSQALIRNVGFPSASPSPCEEHAPRAGSSAGTTLSHSRALAEQPLPSEYESLAARQPHAEPTDRAE